MKVHFAAVHENNTWRKHSDHKTLHAAISGERGAENLLRGLKRERRMRTRYGPVYAVFVWNGDSPEVAHALRLVPGNSYEIERRRIPVDLLAKFTPGHGPSPAQIDKWFSEAASAADWAPEDTPQGGLRDQYRYGDKRTWEIVLDAARSFGRPASATEIRDHVIAHLPGFAPLNVGADLSMLSVNCFSRGNYKVANAIPRRTDTGSPFDQLFRIGSGRDLRFTVYDPGVHGVWALVDVGDKVLRPQLLRTADTVELDNARDAADAAGLFDPSIDARRRVMAAIVQREGQPVFRQALLDAYGGACAISGCTVTALLEAAHIVPYQGPHTNVVENGLLLRADLHKLFDLHLFRIDPVTRTIHLSDELKNSEYACYEGASLRQPIAIHLSPHSDALTHHEERCSWLDTGAGDAPMPVSQSDA